MVIAVVMVVAVVVVVVVMVAMVVMMVILGVVPLLSVSAAEYGSELGTYIRTGTNGQSAECGSCSGPYVFFVAYCCMRE